MALVSWRRAAASRRRGAVPADPAPADRAARAAASGLAAAVRPRQHPGRLADLFNDHAGGPCRSAAPHRLAGHLYRRGLRQGQSEGYHQPSAARVQSSRSPSRGLAGTTWLKSTKASRPCAALDLDSHHPARGVAHGRFEGTSDVPGRHHPRTTSRSALGRAQCRSRATRSTCAGSVICLPGDHGATLAVAGECCRSAWLARASYCSAVVVTEIVEP